MSSNNDNHNKTIKDKHLAAAEMIAFKLKQENKIRDQLKPHFKQVAKQVNKSYLNTGKLPSFDAHKKAVKAIINEHYIDTATKTSTTLRDNFKPVQDDGKLNALIASTIEADAETRSSFAADSVAGTTQDNFKDYIKEGLAAAAIAGVVSSNSDIADYISDKFNDTSDGRIDLISQMETGVAANDGQSDEMDALEDTDAEFDDGSTISDYKRTKTWVAVLDDHTRDEHAEADGQEVDYDEPFDVGGEEMMEPMDDSLGASDWNIYGCLHPDTIVYDTLPLNITRRIYDGKMIVIETAFGNKVTVTANHPVLSNNGWIAVNALQEGNSIICRLNGEGMKLSNLDIQNKKTSIEQIFNSFSVFGVSMRMSSSAMNFHGEDIIDHNVDIIDAHRFLLSTGKAFGNHPIEKLFFPHADVLTSFLSGNSFTELGFHWLTELAMNNISFFSEFLPIFERCLRHSEEHAFRSSSSFYTCFCHTIDDDVSIAFKLFCNSLYGKSFIEQFYNFFNCYGMLVIMRDLSSEVTSFTNGFFVDTVLHIHTYDYNGYVYNIHDVNGYYNGNGIILHNCRCESVESLE